MDRTASKIFSNHDLELVQCFNSEGFPVSARPRNALSEKVWHGVVSIWLVNKDGQLCCSRRSPHLSSCVGKWQPCFGGFIRAKETPRQAAARELSEEIGLKAEDQTLALVVQWKDAFAKRFYFGFACYYDESQELYSNDGEVDDYAWMDYEHYRSSLIAHPSDWCAECRPEDYERIVFWLNKRNELF